MGTSQSYSVSVQPLSHQPWTRSKTTSLPSDISKAHLRAEKKGAVCVGYWKEEAVQGGWMVQGDCDQVQQGGSVTARISPKVSAARGTYAGLGSSLLLSQEGDGGRKPQDSYKKMDDYTEPRDSKKMVWSLMKSEVGASTLSQEEEEEEEEDHYSEPYQQAAGPNGPTWRKSASHEQALEDIYEVADSLGAGDASAIYEVPPSDVDDYSRLSENGTLPPGGGRSKPVPDDCNKSDGEDCYSHTSTWMDQKKDGDRPHAPLQATLAAGTSDEENGHSSAMGADSVMRSPPVMLPESDKQKRFSRQRVIYPRKQSSGYSAANSGVVSGPSPTPALYEDTWDSAEQQKKLEENLRLARNISTTSDTFEDALEYLPDDWAPARSKSWGRKTDEGSGDGGGGGGGSCGKTVDPVTGGAYEEAWDLNRGLEEKLRNLQLMQPDAYAGAEGESNYQEPWDTAKKQQELEEKIHQAQSGGGRRGGHSRQSGGDNYEEAWDTRASLSQMLQCGLPSSARSSQSSPCTIGEPVNAMIPLHNQDWYHGNISRDDAERILRVCKDGSYLVRDSSDRYHYTLSIKSARQTIHIQIDQCRKPDGSMRYILGKNSKAFETIPSMIDHYTCHVVPIRGADHMTLLHPAQCHWSQAGDVKL